MVALAKSSSLLIIVMGVSGSGKTTLATRLSNRFHLPLIEGDSLHPQSNIDTMASGKPLTDAMREPWLAAVHRHAVDQLEQYHGVVVACSALRRKYRRSLVDGIPDYVFVFPTGDRDLILERLKQRPDHFMPAELLDSQLATLESPDGEEHVLRVSIDQPVDDMMEDIVTRLLAHYPTLKNANSGGNHGT
jgi:carbohydrate kinase (thermoresistant glucokinase family)